MVHVGRDVTYELWIKRFVLTSITCPAPTQFGHLFACMLHPQVVGVVIAVLGAVGKANAPLGLLLCLLGTISNGVMTAVSGRILTEKVRPMQPVRPMQSRGYRPTRDGCRCTAE